MAKSSTKKSVVKTSLLKEEERLQTPAWKKWGPYLSERQWGTVREDYSPDGTAWEYMTHDMARSKAFRWGEDGIGGICDDEQLLCFSVALWNKKDAIVKERLFGLTGNEGNHGEDVKELYYYLDNTPTHSYMKMLYKYPNAEFPYNHLVAENKRRTKRDPEFELIDTGVFKNNEYCDVFTEYAKNSESDILIKITIHNHGAETAALNILPQIWFRNTWAWGYDGYKPSAYSDDCGRIILQHRDLGELTLHCEGTPELLFCDNETNTERLYKVKSEHTFLKDGINNYIVHNETSAVNPLKTGTKAAANYDILLKSGEKKIIRLRLDPNRIEHPFKDFDEIFKSRITEADEFYAGLQKDISSDDARLVHRQALAGMLWNKQFYYYDVTKWLAGDPAQPKPPKERLKGRNHDWKHLNNKAIISMPDNWEYPWYASWDSAFHCITLALVDVEFAKRQLLLMTGEWYMHPNGQLPAYEWALGDANPPVQAWAAWHIYSSDKSANDDVGDTAFLQRIFHKLLLNFTWWVNRKDTEGNNIFEGGFLGLDNVGIFDRSKELPTGGYIEQTDGTSWMAMYSLNMMRIALELALKNPVYQDMAVKFFEHFLFIAGAMESMGIENEGLWDEDEQFFYDVLKLPDGRRTKMRTRSIVCLIPLFAVEILDEKFLKTMPEFNERLKWFLKNRPDLAALVSRWHEKNQSDKHLLSLLRGHRTQKLVERILDETEFLSPYGVRSLSKYHEEHPYHLKVNGDTYSIRYTPGESTSGIFGGNSNWRGPVWMPINFLIIESLKRFHSFYGDVFEIEYPAGSGKNITLKDAAEIIAQRLTHLFLKDENGNRAFLGNNEKFQSDPAFKDYILFYEYFHGDTGCGVGASHQTGWTGLVANILQNGSFKKP